MTKKAKIRMINIIGYSSLIFFVGTIILCFVLNK